MIANREEDSIAPDGRNQLLDKQHQQHRANDRQIKVVDHK